MGRLAGKRAIVTGGGSGLGRATSLLFAEQGARVLVNDINADNAAAVAAEIAAAGGEAHALQADVSQAADAERLVAGAVERFGGLDVLINNAGVFRQGTVAQATDDDWEHVIGVNLYGVFACSRAALPVMAQGGGGSIVCVSSISGVIGQALQPIYNASKHGVIGLVRCMAMDHAAQGIRVNAVCPGLMDTPLIGFFSEADMAEAAAKNFLNRAGTPAEIAQLVLFLASDEAAFVTGAAMFADGGETAR